MLQDASHDLDRYITTTELEQRFRREIRSIRRWEETKNFPPAVIVGRGTENLWLRDQVHQWEMAQAQSTGWSMDQTPAELEQA